MASSNKLQTTYKKMGTAHLMVDFLKDPDHPDYKKLFANCLQKIEEKEVFNEIMRIFAFQQEKDEKQARLEMTLKEEAAAKDKERLEENTKENLPKDSLTKEDSKLIDNLFSSLADLHKSEVELQKALDIRDKHVQAWNEQKVKNADAAVNIFVENKIELPDGNKITVTANDPEMVALRESLINAPSLTQVINVIEQSQILEEEKKLKEQASKDSSISSEDFLERTVKAREKITKAVTEKAQKEQGMFFELKTVVAGLKRAQRAIPDYNAFESVGNKDALRILQAGKEIRESKGQKPVKDSEKVAPLSSKNAELQLIKTLTKQVSPKLTKQINSINKRTKEELNDNETVKKCESSCKEKNLKLTEAIQAISENGSSALKPIREMVVDAHNNALQKLQEQNIVIEDLKEFKHISNLDRKL